MQTAARRSFDYDMPLIQTPTSACQIRQAWAKVADTPDRETAGRLKDEIKALLKEKNAVLVAHYYVDPLIQDLALETGGCVGDSLEMARFGAEHEADTLVVAGVRFMGESAKILCPEKTVLMPDLEAECSLDLGCPEEAFSAFCDQHPDRTVVVYANTSAAVKARADWVVTSSVALEIVSYLKSRGEKLIWGPDRHLGDYIRRETGADMLLWQGSCIVHNEFKGQELAALKAEHPDAVVLVHPESPQSVIELGDVVGSTSKLLKAAVSRPEKKIHRGDRFGHPARNAKAGARQRIYRRTDGGQRRKLQKLRVLPVDGDEFAGRHQIRPDKRTQRNPVGQEAGRSRQTAFAAYARLRGRAEEKRCVQRHGPRLICRQYCRFRRPLKQGQHHANRLRRIDCRKRAGGTDARPVAA